MVQILRSDELHGFCKPKECAEVRLRYELDPGMQNEYGVETVSLGRSCYKFFQP